MTALVIHEEDLLGTFEQKKALVAQFNLMDDMFFSVVMEHNDAAEYLLTQLMGKPVKIIENKTQYSIRNAEAHSIVLDALVEDEEHNPYDVEVQVGDKDNHERRLRYYSTAVDWSYLEKGKDYSELPELYMIFISDFDPFEMNKVQYEIVQYVKGTEVEYDNGIHIHYFNTKVDDGTFLAELLQYMENSDPQNDKFGALSRQVGYHKYRNEEAGNMCKAVEDYGNEREELSKLKKAVEVVKDMLKDSVPFETALKYAKIDKATFEKYSEREKPLDSSLDDNFTSGLIPWLCEYYQSHAGEKIYLRNAIDEYVKEYYAIKVVKNMLQGGISLETALECAKIDKATFEKHSESLQ